MEFDKEKLAENNGKEGKPAYVVYEGKVYDVTSSRLWKNGKHMNRHLSGDDLSAEMSAAPHGPEVLNKFTVVGELKEISENEIDRPPVPVWLNNLLEKYPFFKRHPHPMVVHFPMTFFITATLFLLWYYLVSPIHSLLDGIFYMHILGTISLPAAILTGWLSWKVNYLGKKMPNITRKIVMTCIVLVFDLIVLVAMINDTYVLVNPQGWQMILPIFIFLYLPIVSFIGQQGGDLVY